MPLTSFDHALARADLATVSQHLGPEELARRAHGQGLLTRALAVIARADLLDRQVLRQWRLLLREGALDAPPGQDAHLVELAQVPCPPQSRILVRQALRDLREAGARFNTPTPEGTTPLMAALTAGNALFAELLIEAGADPTWTPSGQALHRLIDAVPTPSADLRMLRARLAEQHALAELRQARGHPPRRRAP